MKKTSFQILKGCRPLESDYTWVTADTNVHNWEQRKVTVSEAVIYCAPALKEFYLSINRKAQKAEEPFRNIFVLQHDQEIISIIRTYFAGTDKFIYVNCGLTF